MKEKIPYQVTDLTNNKVLILAAHADDEILGCGGTLIKHLRAKDQVRIIILTDDIISINQTRRKKEAQRVFDLLKIKDVRWLGFKDGQLSSELSAGYLQKEIKVFLPTLIYTPGEQEIHPDHVALAKATQEAFIMLKKELPLILASYEISSPLLPNTLVDITKEANLKFKALKYYSSQLAQNDYLTKIKGLNRYRTYTLPKNIKYAEAFQIIK
ncbi:MAG: PIG-L family deacetylase [Candidatus Omnitrophica bacterium]|jgi:LmbE family N-acetylglucosaminyl deacetylase|nr:PIG-L family deacetylase [Candidatus Omnitrophota bacterium]